MFDRRSMPPRELHLLTCVLLAIVLAFALLAHVSRSFAFADRIPADPVHVAQVEYRIDPNTAGWAELTVLPGVGEALARRIVAGREGKPPGAGPAYRCPADLDVVKGIGPRLIERMEPWLRFPATDRDR